jgi:hypothetical protein
VSGAEDLNRPEEGEIEKREGHGPFSRSHPLRRKSQLNGSDEILGTHRVFPKLFVAISHIVAGAISAEEPLVTTTDGVFGTHRFRSRRRQD